MCGIAGALGAPPEWSREAAGRMLAALAHRGPDADGETMVQGAPGSPPALLVHARLAIFDLSPAGRQPMTSAPEPAAPPDLWIVFNGEIFNFPEIRAELESLGRRFVSRSDTEVILEAYRQWGPACVERMRGMFAWCLLDRRDGSAWLCRDRLGVKPLYLRRRPAGGLIFASEVRALLASAADEPSPRLDRTALESFLAQGAVMGTDSIFEGIEMLPPAAMLRLDWDGRERSRREYWTLPFHPAGTAAPPDRGQAVEELAAGLRESVRLRLAADVPVGVFLSGGVDSCAVAAAATGLPGAEIRTVSVGFDQPEFDETEAAEAAARQLGSSHLSIRLTGGDVLKDFDAVLAAADQPTVDGFNTYFVSRAARRSGLTVALSGVGGDELFGGYASFRDVPRATALRRLAARTGPLARLAPRAAALRGGRRGAKAAALFSRDPDPVRMYFLRRELFGPAERRAMGPAPEGADPQSGIPFGFVSALRDSARGLDPENQVSLFELRGYMGNMLLRDSDVFSMAHGLELRTPLLDHKFVETAAGLPGAWKRPDPRPKPLLVDAAGPRLPRRSYETPKRGFTFPWGPWLRGPLRERAAAAANQPEVWTAAGLDPKGPAEAWRRFDSGDSRISPLQALALMVLGDFLSRRRPAA